MDDLEIKIAIVFKVPRNALSLNGLLRGLARDRDRIMRETLVQIFAALEENLHPAYPQNRYVRNGRQSSARQFHTSFGPVRYALAQVVDRKTGRTIQPLAVLLRIPAYRRYHCVLSSNIPQKNRLKVPTSPWGNIFIFSAA